MKLIGTFTSPFVRKVRVVLVEKKIDCEFVLDSPWDAASNVSGINPLGKVPILILDDSTVLFDSSVIVEYIDSLAPHNKLIPESNRERAKVKRWAALADGVCDAAAQIFLERKRPPVQCSQEWIDRQYGKIARGCEYMADGLDNGTYCLGKQYTLAEVGIGCALGYLDFRLPEINWRERHAKLARLYATLMQRPAFIDTVPQD